MSTFIKHTKSLLCLETFFIIFFWILLFASPFLLRPSNLPIFWPDIFRLWIRQYVPLFLLFLLNRFVLAPHLLFKNKRVLYFLCVVSVVVLTLVLSYNYHIKVTLPAANRAEFNNLQGSRPNPEDAAHFFPRRPVRQPRPLPPYINLLFLSILIIGFDTGLKTSFRWVKTDRERELLEKGMIESQLQYLRNQVNPHFFMNTLNNLHALVDIDAEKAKESIIMLSKLMRYLLYETNRENTPLKKEIEFLESYVALMKIRLPEKVKISFIKPDKIPAKSIPPLLFTSLIENAFKHGISYEENSFVEIVIQTSEQELTLSIKNSKPSFVRKTNSSGIGLENTRNRLNLIYPDKHTFDIRDEEKIFHVTLKIPI